MNLIFILVNLAWRLTELSFRLMFQLLGLLLGFIARVIAAAFAARKLKSQVGRHQPPRRHRRRRVRRWQK